MSLTGAVVGSGFAAEGHIVALQSAGVEVVVVCGRNRVTVEDKAKKHGVVNSRSDWRNAIEEFHPDIVSVALPAGPL